MYIYVKTVVNVIVEIEGFAAAYSRCSQEAAVLMLTDQVFSRIFNNW